MPYNSGSIANFSSSAISDTYQRIVQTDGTYLADGTGSLINNITIPGNLVVSGTLYAQNTVVVTQSFSSGSNILGDAVDDFQTLYGTVRIPTGSLTITGSVTSTGTITSTAVYPNLTGFATSGSLFGGVGYHANTWRGTYTGAAFSFVSNTYTSSVSNFVLAGTRPLNPNFAQFQLYVKTDNTTVLDTGGGGPILDIAANGTSYARFDGSNFSIGATSALSKLYISGSSSQALLRIDSPATSSIIYVSGSGAIGFNYTSSLNAQATFRGVQGSLNFTEINTTANGAYGLRTDGPVKAANYFLANAGGGSIQTYTGVDIMTFNSSRNVGISVSSSIGARLHIRGAGTTTATTTLLVQNANASSSLIVLDNGNVYSNGPGFIASNTAFGFQSLNNPSGSATQNAAFGYQNFVANNYSGFDNVAIGYRAIQNATTGYQNMGIGTETLQNLTVGSGNTAVGHSVLRFATANTTNTGIGFYSLYTLGANQGNSNTAIGVNALQVLATGSSNIAIGSGTGAFRSGSANIFIAAGAPGIITGSGNVIIGNNQALSSSLNNTIAISDGSGNMRIYVSSSGNLGLGTTTPTAKLHVSGSPGTDSAVAIYKSGSNVLSIDGSSGRLFSVDDSLSGSLFSVNTAAGLPTIEAFSDNTVNIGKYNVYPIKVVSNGTAAAITGSFSGSIRATSITLTGSLNVSGSQNYVGDVNILGTLTATVKSFLIEHPTQPGKKLQYGNLEGPEHAVYFRGRSTSSIIEFPEEWSGLVNEETVTVQLTPIGGYQPLYVSNVTSTRVEIQVAQPMALNYHYLIHGERKDIDKLITTVN